MPSIHCRSTHFNVDEFFHVHSKAKLCVCVCVLIRHGCSFGYTYDDPTSISTYTPFIDSPSVLLKYFVLTFVVRIRRKSILQQTLRPKNHSATKATPRFTYSWDDTKHTNSTYLISYNEVHAISSDRRREMQNLLTNFSWAWMFEWEMKFFN